MAYLEIFLKWFLRSIDGNIPKLLGPYGFFNIEEKFVNVEGGRKVKSNTFRSASKSIFTFINFIRALWDSITYKLMGDTSVTHKVIRF